MVTKRSRKPTKTRHHISLRPEVYARLKAHCKQGGIPMASLVESLLADLPEAPQ